MDNREVSLGPDHLQTIDSACAPMQPMTQERIAWFALMDGVEPSFSATTTTTPDLDVVCVCVSLKKDTKISSLDHGALGKGHSRREPRLQAGLGRPSLGRYHRLQCNGPCCRRLEGTRDRLVPDHSHSAELGPDVLRQDITSRLPSHHLQRQMLAIAERLQAARQTGVRLTSYRMSQVQGGRGWRQRVAGSCHS